MPLNFGGQMRSGVFDTVWPSANTDVHVVFRPCLASFASFGQKGRSRAPYAQQRSLHYILAQCPTTAGSAQFCLLCCQPEPVPGSSTARVPQLTPWNPCRLPAWSGRTINMRYRTCCVPVHSITQTPTGEQESGYSQCKQRCLRLGEVGMANKIPDF